MSKKRHLDFIVRWHNGRRIWSTAQVCDYPAIRDGEMTLRKAHYHIIRRPIMIIEFNDDHYIGNPTRFMFCRPTGFTYLDIMACIYKAYFKMYKDIRKYGIWGHSMGDLFLEGLTINGPGDYELVIGS